MGIPVKLKEDGFVYMGEVFAKGDIFNAPHEAFASFLCDQEKQATRVNEEDCEPEKVNTMKRVMKGGSYTTKVMKPSEDDAPVITKTEDNKPAKKKSKSTAKKK